MERTRELISRTLIIFLTVLVLTVTPGVAQVTEGDDGPLRIGRIEVDGKVLFGMLSVGGVHVIDRDFFDEDARLSGVVHKLDSVKILAPLSPSKVILSSENYRSKRKLSGKQLGYVAREDLFVLPTQSVIGVGSDVKISGELVVVIGESLKNVTKKQAGEAIVGVTIGARIFGRDNKVNQVVLGPWLVPGLSHNRLELGVKVNGKRKRVFSTGQMTFSVEEIVAQISRQYQLTKGDVIFTGYAGRKVDVAIHDKINVSLEGVGALDFVIGETENPETAKAAGAKNQGSKE